MAASTFPRGLIVSCCCFLIFFLGTTTAVSNNWLITGTGNSGLYLQFLASNVASGTSQANIYGDQTIPKSYAVIPPTSLGSTHTTYVLLETGELLEMTYSTSSGFWTAGNAYSLGGADSPTFVEGANTWKVTLNSQVYDLTISSQTLCSASSTSGFQVTVSGTTGLVAAGIYLVDGTGPFTTATTTSYVSAYDTTSTPTFTVKAKGFSTSTSEAYYVAFVVDDGAFHFCTVPIESTAFTFIQTGDPLDVFKAGCTALGTSSVSVTGTGGATLSVSGGAILTGSYTFAVSQEAASC